MNEKILKWIKGLGAFLIAIIITIIYIRSFRNDIIDIEVVSASTGNIVYELSSPDFSQNLQDTLKERNTYINQPESLHFFIPAQVISQVQLNFIGKGGNNKEIIIYQIKVNGKNVDLSQMLDSRIWHGIESVKMQDKKLLLNDCQDQAFMIFPEKIRFQGERRYNWYLLISMFLC